MKSGIYIHIPFCARKCRYCDFFSYAADESTKLAYIKALVREIEAYGKIIRKSENKVEISTVYIGGGTPSVVPAEYIDEILRAISLAFCNGEKFQGQEITIEMNPATVTQDKLEKYRESGINRISIGMQSANDKELELLGRLHSYDDFVACYEMVRKTGFRNVNIDVMSALPRQTISSYEDTLQKVIDLDPEHISSYSLIIEQGTPFYGLYGENGSKKSELPDEDTERDMYDLTVEKLAEAGYERYEISNYSKAGMYSRHNTSYWKRTPYHGFGAGASSFWGNKRWKNTSDMKKYLQLDPERLEEIRTEVEDITRMDAMSETVFLGLRMTKGISKKEFFEAFNEDIHAVFGKEIEKHVKAGTMIEEGDRLFLSERGIDVSNYVFADFV